MQMSREHMFICLSDCLECQFLVCSDLIGIKIFRLTVLK